ncbi:MAG: rhodanese-like domain-containing protein [Nitrospirae bacterium]|nr:rhodanese-like domain-containing protein [Nitrospirota bacterium]
MKRCLLIALSAIFVMSGICFADMWPEDVVKKIDAITEIEKEKKELPVTILDGLNVSVISGEEVHKIWKSNKTAIVDTRNKTQYDTERIEGATHLPADDLIKDPSLANGLDKDKDYVVYCNGVKCPRSPRAAIMMKHLGFKKVYWYREGMPDWKSKGYPTE